MRDSVGNKFLGLFILVIGLLIGLNTFNIIDVSLFFAGWWTLFIIIPCLTSIIKNGIKVGNTIGLTIGLLMFLSEQNIVSWNLVEKLIVPIIFVTIGLGIMFKNDLKYSKVVKKINENMNTNKNALNNYSAVFSGQEINVFGEKFTGANIDAVFGGFELNLKNAIIDEDIVLNISAIFGGVDIVVPNNVIVKVSSTPIFGGVSNKVNNNSGENLHTIYVNATCMFGGVDIK